MSIKERDNPKNPIGANTADNNYDSSSVVANADGSILERLEHLQQLSKAVEGYGVATFIHVDSATGSDSNDGLTWATALATWDAAFALVAANNGDKILLAPGHAETFSTTGTKVTGDKAGVETIALGEGADKATFTFTHVDATMVFSAASQKIKGIRFVTGVDQVVTYATISGNDIEIDVTTLDATDKEVISDFTITGDRFKAKITKHGYTSGDGNDVVLSMNGVDTANIELDCITKVLTSVVEFVTAACSNIRINGTVLVSGTTNGSKLVVDTITGSTYFYDINDEGAGDKYFGGSGRAATPLHTDITSINSKINTLDAVADRILGNNNVLKTTIADGTTLTNNTQVAAGLLATASGDVLIEEITVQRASTNFVGPTNLEFTVDNAAGLTGVDAPLGVLPLADFNANNTAVVSLDGSTKQLPFVLEDGKKLYIHGDDAAVSAGGSTDFFIKFSGVGIGTASIS